MSFADGKSLAWTEGNLGPVYLGNVKSLKRGVLYVPPRTVILVDRLESEEDEATMEALFHGPKYAGMNTGDKTFTIRSGVQTLTGTVLKPSDPRLSLDPDKVKLSMFTDDPIEPLGRVAAKTETRSGTALATVMLSTDNRVRNTNKAGTSTLYEIDGATVLLNPEGRMTVNGAIGTDGAFAALGDEGAFLMVDGTIGSIDSEETVNADSPVTILLEGDRAWYSSPIDTVIRIKRAAMVQGVFIDGLLLTNWTRDTNTFEVTIPVRAGTHEIEMRR